MFDSMKRLRFILTLLTLILYFVIKRLLKRTKTKSCMTRYGKVGGRVNYRWSRESNWRQEGGPCYKSAYSFSAGQWTHAPSTAGAARPEAVTASQECRRALRRIANRHHTIRRHLATGFGVCPFAMPRDKVESIPSHAPIHKIFWQRICHFPQLHPFFILLFRKTCLNLTLLL